MLPRSTGHRKRRAIAETLRELAAWHRAIDDTVRCGSTNHAVLRVNEFARPPKGNDRALEFTERPLDQDLLLLEVHEEVVPERLLRKDLWIAKNDEAERKLRFFTLDLNEFR